MAPGDSFLAPILQRPAVAHQFRNQRTGLLVASTIETAFDHETRRRGLLGRDGLPSGTALIIAPCSSIHTFFMRFPIDVAFVSREGQVVKIYRAMPAWRLGAALQAYAVIELPAHALEASGTQPGDQVDVVAAPDA